MKTKLVLTLLLGATVLPASAADATELTNQKEKISYALGMNLGNNLHRLGVAPDEIDTALLLQGLKDAQTGSKTILPETNMFPVLQEFQREAMKKVSDRNKKQGEEFLAANKQKEGVKVLPVKVGENTYELQYKILAEGSGTPPTTNDQVSVNYRGMFLDGTEFDSSYKRGQPAQFPLTRVIRGWTEGLQLVKPGGKIELFIPPELAYGPGGNRNIPGNSTLTFEVELLSVQPVATPPAPRPEAVTSDIIKVPSKEELEKGAKIEVIKAADVEKLKQQEKEKEKGKTEPEKK